jgi:hypothetical protein
MSMATLLMSELKTLNQHYATRGERILSVTVSTQEWEMMFKYAHQIIEAYCGASSIAHRVPQRVIFCDVLIVGDSSLKLGERQLDVRKKEIKPHDEENE